MPLLLLAAALILLVLLSIALLPFSFVLRYRAGTARRPARGWMVTLNLVGLSLSSVLFLLTAAFTTRWVPGAFRYALTGFGVGCVLGTLGLLLTRWEPGSRALYYTPNRWLVLGITLVVTARVGYGFWRTWHAWRAAYEHTSLIVVSGVSGSLAAGAVVLGYYVTYWAGVRRRIRRFRSR
ncbi:MAG: DUF1453 domain-containing protein [Acidobacteria bacterium]|nr:MAG: DUF1453 domain-containing protein [Acidobacteriota bacterium]